MVKKTDTTNAAAAAPAAGAAAQPEHRPTQGGSYTRQEDGSLTREEGHDLDAPVKTIQE